MPLFEYECDSCMDGYNRDIDALVAKPNKTNAAKIKKNNAGILYVLDILSKPLTIQGLVPLVLGTLLISATNIIINQMIKRSN